MLLTAGLCWQRPYYTLSRTCATQGSFSSVRCYETRLAVVPRKLRVACVQPFLCYSMWIRPCSWPKPLAGASALKGQSAWGRTHTRDKQGWAWCAHQHVRHRHFP